jgi:L-threonylcarbamoyladenylate synthase
MASQVYRFRGSHYDVRLMTDVIRVAPDSPDPAALLRAAECLRRGGLVAFPTETVYGLGVNALDRQAVQRLFAAKQRPANDPLIVHVTSAQGITSLAARVPDSLEILARRFWPGPLTVIVPKSHHVPDEVTAGLATVAVRVPMHPVARALIEAAGIPVAAPSANLFSRPSPTQASHVIEDLDGRIDLVVDGGATAIGVESTVLDLTSDPPMILRPGAITADMLRGVLGRVDVWRGSRARHATAAAALPAPGMLERHYSPRAPLTLFEGDTSAALPALIAAARNEISSGRWVGIIAPDEDRDALAPLASDRKVLLQVIGSNDAPAVIAKRLYATLRELDAAGADVILVHGFRDDGLGEAVQDRLRRAAAGRIVKA